MRMRGRPPRQLLRSVLVVAVTSFSRVMNNYVAQRIATSAIIFGTLLFGGRVVDVDIFSTILLAMFLAKFLQIFNFGATSGYFVCYYNTTGLFEKQEHHDDVDFSFVLYLSAQLTVIAAACLALSVLTEPQYIPGLLAFLILVPAYSLEPAFRRRRRFYFSLLPDVLLALGLLAVSVLVAMGWVNLGVEAYLIALLCLCAVTYGAVAIRLSYRLSCFRFKLRPTFRTYGGILKCGFPVYFGSTAFMFASGADRLFLPLHDDLLGQATYLLAFQLVSGAMIVAGSINFVNTIDLGTEFQIKKRIDSRIIARKLAIASAVTSLSFSALVLGTIVMENSILSKYNSITLITAAIGLGLSMFFAAGSITPVLGYLRMQTPMTILMTIVAIAVVLNNIVSLEYSLSLLWRAVFTSLLLAAYAVLAVCFTITQADKASNEF